MRIDKAVFGLMRLSTQTFRINDHWPMHLLIKQNKLAPTRENACVRHKNGDAPVQGLTINDLGMVPRMNEIGVIPQAALIRPHKHDVAQEFLVILGPNKIVRQMAYRSHWQP